MDHIIKTDHIYKVSDSFAQTPAGHCEIFLILVGLGETLSLRLQTLWQNNISCLTSSSRLWRVPANILQFNFQMTSCTLIRKVYFWTDFAPLFSNYQRQKGWQDIVNEADRLSEFSLSQFHKCAMMGFFPRSPTAVLLFLAGPINHRQFSNTPLAITYLFDFWIHYPTLREIEEENTWCNII